MSIKKKYILYIMSSIFFIVLNITVPYNKDNIIIRYHLKGYYFVRNVVWVMTLLLIVIILLAVKKIQKQKKEAQEAVQSHIENEERIKKAEAYLSVSKDLDSSLIQELLAEKSYKEWKNTRDQLLTVLEQLKKMDTYQIQLSRLLTNNGAKALNSTQEVLDKVEQYLCRNVRKCLNHMGIADPGKSEDVLFIQKKLTICIEDNDEKLKQIDDFLRTIVEFLNKQGDEEAESSIGLLDTYKKTILESISGDFV